MPAQSVNRVKVPASARYRHGALKNFKNDVEAYAFGRFALAALYNHQPSSQWCHDNGISVQNAQTGSDNSLGGYLIPTELEQTIIDLRVKYGVVRNYAKIVPMGSDTKNVPVRLTGLTAYWGGVDTSGITASDKTWGNAQLVAKDLYALCRVSNNLNDDSVISVGDDLAGEIAQAFSYSEDNAAFNGTGTSASGGINGILTKVLAIKNAATGHDTWAELDLGDFEGALGMLAHYPGINPAWFCSKKFYHTVMLRLLDAAGGNTIANLAGGPGGQSFLGYPVVFTQVMPAEAAATACAVVGDLAMGTVMGNRRGMSIATSEHSRFAYDQMEIRGHQRVDFVVHAGGVGTATEGPIVVLKTAS